VRGSLEQRAKNAWRARVYLGRDAGGRQRYLTRTFHGTKRIADEKLRELLAEAGRGGGLVIDGTLAELVERWRATADANLSPTTLSEYRRLLDRLILPRFGRTRVRNLRAADLDAFYSDLQKVAVEAQSGDPGLRPLVSRNRNPGRPTT
jgi:hypothetical protein